MALYRSMTNKELAVWAEQDPRFGQDALFTELTVRVRDTNSDVLRKGGKDGGDNSKPEVIDVR